MDLQQIVMYWQNFFRNCADVRRVTFTHNGIEYTVRTYPGADGIFTTKN